MPRRSTLIALLIAVGVSTGVVLNRTARLRAVEALGPPAHVDWTLWWLAVGVGYVGLALIGWVAIDRDRRHGSAPETERPADAVRGRRGRAS